ncbi:DNA sulfur modification protein DndB [[Kitasatospora] papulosa]|uniref:DNA sulfur modification protein DndB n=1 Tax=[Kitasatospora] papulosa TaxID=1464011 RepID=UPI00368D0963
MSRSGKLHKISWTEPMRSMAELWNFESLIDRSNYNLNDHGRPGQRDISESQIKKITDGIRTSERPYIGTLVVGMEYDIGFVKIEKGVEVMPGVFLVKITIYEGAPIIWSVDGQYRVMAVTRCCSSVKDAVEGDALSARRVIEESAVEPTLLLEGDHDILADLFITMASTKPISPSLIAVMDKSSTPNRLGQHVIRRATLFEGRATYLASAAHKELAKETGDAFEALYPAAAARSAASAVAGVGVRDRSSEIRDTHLDAIVQARTAVGSSGDEALALIGDEVVELLDLAHERMPGWREIAEGTISVTEFRQQYLHSAAAGLHVIANCIVAARIAKVPVPEVLDALVEIPWRRDALQTVAWARVHRSPTRSSSRDNRSCPSATT